MSGSDSKPKMTPGARYPGDPWDDEGRRLISRVMSILVVVMCIALFLQSGKYQNGNWIVNTPMPTATPIDHQVKMRIEEVKMVDGNTNLVVTVLNDEYDKSRKGTRWLVRISASAYPELFDKVGWKIEMNCYHYSDFGYIFCNPGYKLKD